MGRGCPAGVVQRAFSASAAQQHFFPGIKRMSNLVIERGAGCTVWTREGEPFLDLTAGIGVVSTGHCHPRVVDAVREQAGKISHAQMSCHYSDISLRLAERLLPVLPGTPHGPMDRIFFATSGAEAVENAIRAARFATGRDGVIALTGGYHGRTAGTLALTSSNPSYRGSRSGPLPGGVYFAPYPYQYAGVDEQEALKGLKAVIKHHLNPCELAAVIIEPVLGEGGYVPAPPDYMKELRAFCDEHGALLVADEVQSGVARTGQMWGIQRSEVAPDILISAKGLASGYPLSAVGAPAIHTDGSVQAPNSFGGTYGGNAVACAAALATLDVIDAESLVQNAEDRGQQLMDGLRRLQQSKGLIGDIRGHGLMIGCEFDPDLPDSSGIAARISAACLERNMLLLPCGVRQTLRFAPPLVLTQDECETALQIFGEALEQVSTTLSC